MKTKLLFALIVLSLAACTPEDTRNHIPYDEDPTPESPEGKPMGRIVQTDFNEDGSVLLTTRTDFDDDNKATAILEYNGNGELLARREYTYNAKGLLETMNHYTVATNPDAADYSTTVTYDANGRVTNVSESFTLNGSPATAQSLYVYGSDKVVATRTLSSGGSGITTYLLNTSGKIYKKTDPSGNTEQLVYSGDNIFSYSNGSLTSTYTYDNVRELKGEQHSVIVNQYKGNLLNAMMLGGLTAIDLGYTRFPVQRAESTGDVYDYDYKFDDDDYPISIKFIKNGNSLPYAIREIYYK